MANGQTTDELYRRLGISPAGAGQTPRVGVKSSPPRAEEIMRRLTKSSVENNANIPSEYMEKEDELEEKGWMEKAFSEFTLDKNVDRSIYQTIRDERPEQYNEIIASVERKKKTSNMIKQSAARLTSALPIFGPSLSEKYLKRSKVDFTPTELEALRDPLSPVHDSGLLGLSSFSAPIPFGGGERFDARDISELTVHLARFAGIGGMTKYGLQKLPMFKNGKFLRLLTSNSMSKRLAARASKAAVEFNIDGYSNLYPELAKEGIPLEEKIHSAVMAFPKQTISGSLFGIFGGARGVIKQYGGIFAAGYTSAMIEGAGHKESYKSGTLLTLMHFTNVLGSKAGKKAFGKWGKKNNVSDEDIEYWADMIVEEKHNPKKPIWRVGNAKKFKLESNEQGKGRVQVVKETGKGNKRFVVVKDLESIETGTKKISANAFYKHFQQGRTPTDSNKVRSFYIRKIQGNMKDLGISGTEKEQQLKRDWMGGKQKPIQERKEGEIPYYEYLSRKSKLELLKVAERYGLDTSKIVKMTQKDAVSYINKHVPRQPGNRLSLTEATPEQLYRMYHQTTKDLTKRNVIQDIEMGIYRPDKNGNKIHVEPEDLYVAVQDVVRSKLRGDQSAAFEALTEAKRFKDILKKHKIPYNRQREIIRAAAGEKGVEKTLSVKEVEALEMWRETFESGRIFAEKSGVLENAIEDYWPGVFKGDRKVINKAINEYIKANPDSRFAKEKKFRTPTEAEKFAKEAGLEVIYDIPYLVETYWRSIGEATATRRFLQRVKDLPNNTTGDRIVSENYIEGYRRVDDPYFARAVTGNPKKTSVYVDRNFAGEFMYLTKRPESPFPMVRKVSKHLNWATSNIKRVIMYNPLIHGWNIYSDTFDELWFSSWKNVLPIVKTARLTGLFPGIKYSPKKQLKMYKDIGFDGTLEDLRRVMAKGGVNQEITGRRGVELEEYMKEQMPDLTQNPMVHIGKHPIKTLKQLSDKALWGRIVQSAQETVFALKYSNFLKEGFSKKRAGVMAGHFTNDLLGTTGAEVFAPREGAILNSLFFARNWTVSNLRLLTGAMGVRGQNAQFLSHKGLTKPEIGALQKEYAKHLVKGVVGLYFFTNVLNKLATGTGGFQHSYKEEQARWAFKNPEGHTLDVDLGVKDNKNQQIYVVMPLFRYMRDYFGWYGEPAQTFFNKVSPFWKQLLEQTLNYSFWSKRAIAPRGADDLTKAKRRFRYLVEGLTPVSQIPAQRFSRPGVVRNWYELWTPAIGTWVRHGTAGGRSGELINEFLAEEKFKRDEIDTVLDELLQEAEDGDLSGAIEEIARTKRYKTLSGVRDRLLRFRDPLHYKWSVMLNKGSRVQFLEWLRKNYPKEYREVKKEILEAPAKRNWQKK